MESNQRYGTYWGWYLLTIFNTIVVAGSAYYLYTGYQKGTKDLIKTCNDKCSDIADSQNDFITRAAETLSDIQQSLKQTPEEVAKRIEESAQAITAEQKNFTEAINRNLTTLQELEHSLETRVPKEIEQAIHDSAEGINQSQANFTANIDEYAKAINAAAERIRTEVPKEVQANMESNKKELQTFQLNIEKNIESKLDELNALSNRIAGNDLKTIVDNITTSTEQLKEAQRDMQSTVLTANGQIKAAAYLDEARKCEDIETKRLLYERAIDLYIDKMPAILEYVDWVGGEIQKQAATENTEDYNASTERFGMLVSECNSMLTHASLSDVQAIPDLQQRLEGIESAIKQNRADIINTQASMLIDIEKSKDKLFTYSDCEKLRANIAAIEVDGSLSDRKDKIIQDIFNKQSCLTSPTDELMLPEICEDTPWNEWLDNFIKRLDADETRLSLEQKMKDISEASDFLQAAEKLQGAQCREQIRRIDTQIQALEELQWEKQVDNLLAGKSQESEQQPSNTEQIASLLAQGKTLTVCRNKQKHDAAYVKLNLKYFDSVREEIEISSQNLLRKNEQSSVGANPMFSDELSIQLWGAIQSQYANTLLQLQLLAKDYQETSALEKGDANSPFSDQGNNDELNRQIVVLQERLRGTERMIDSIRKQIAIHALSEEKKRNEKYRDQCLGHITAANIAFNNAETAKSSEEKESYYKQAWMELRKIHPGDFQSVAPHQYHMYEKIKKKADNKCDPSEEELMSDPNTERIYDVKL